MAERKRRMSVRAAPQATRVYVGLDAPTHLALVTLAQRLDVPVGTAAGYLITGAMADHAITRAAILASIGHDLASMDGEGRHPKARRKRALERGARVDQSAIAGRIETVTMSVRIGPGANLTGADLRGANLLGVDLHGAHLAHANLSRARLGLANLAGADLFGADLSDADLFGALLAGADLSHANLAGADCTGAITTGATLTGTNVQGAIGFVGD